MGRRKPEDQLCYDWGILFNRMENVQGHERIENSVKNGTPDYTYTIGGVNGWIEYKVITSPKRSTTKLNLRHWTGPQRKWLLDRRTSKQYS